MAAEALSELIEEHFREVVFAQGHGPTAAAVMQQLDRLRWQLPINQIRNIPILIDTWNINNSHLSVAVPGGSIHFQLAWVHVTSLDEAIEAAEGHSLLVELNGRDAADASIPVVGRVSHANGGNGIICCGQQYLDAGTWEDEVDCAYNIVVRLTQRAGDVLSLRQDYKVIDEKDFQMISSTISTDPVPDNIRETTQEDCVTVVWKMWRSETTKPKELENLLQVVRAMLASAPHGAEANMIIVNPEMRVIKFSSIASRPGERETSRSVFKGLREVWKTVDGGVELLTDLVLKASLESHGTCWERGALLTLFNALENHLPDELPDDKKVKFRAQHHRLWDLVGVLIGFLVLSNAGRLHMIGVTPADCPDTGSASAAARLLFEKGEFKWNVFQSSATECNFYRPNASVQRII